jgi:hypothetical protein
MEPKFIFAGDLKKHVEIGADVTLYGTKLWRTFQEVLKILALKFKPTLEFDFDIISNYKKHGAKYGVYPVANHEGFDYVRLCKETISAIDRCVQFGLRDNEALEKHFMLKKLYQILEDFGAGTFEEDEDKKLTQIEKSLLRFVKKFSRKYGYNIIFFENEEDEEGEDPQLELLGPDEPSFIVKKEKGKKLKLDDCFEGKIKSFSFCEGYPSVITMLEEPDKELKVYFNHQSQHLVLMDGLSYKNKDLEFKVTSDKDAKIITVAIVG